MENTETPTFLGKKIIECTKPQLFDPPKEMLVWDELSTLCPTNRKVCAIVKNANGKTFAVAHHLSNSIDLCIWDHCGTFEEISEETKPADDRLATYRELAMWLAKGNGEYKIIGYLGAGTNHEYLEEHGSKPLSHDYLVRKWTETEWHEPTIAYMGL